MCNKAHCALLWFGSFTACRHSWLGCMKTVFYGAVYSLKIKRKKPGRLTVGNRRREGQHSADQTFHNESTRRLFWFPKCFSSVSLSSHPPLCFLVDQQDLTQTLFTLTACMHALFHFFSSLKLLTFKMPTGLDETSLNVVYYCTGHGLGHATRSLEVCKHLIAAGHHGK